MTAFGLKNVCLEYGTDVILDNISFALNENERLGIVGVNGAGKSSLLNIIAGEPATSGDVFVAKDRRVGLLKQNACIDSDLTVYDEMLTAFSHLTAAKKRLSEMTALMEKEPEKYAAAYADENERFIRDGGLEFEARTRSALSGVGFSESDLSRRVSSLSGGERTRLALVAMILSAPDILMLDEPTNHLDIKALDWLESTVLSYRGTVVIVSHDRYFLDRTATKILELANGKGTLYNGNYGAYAEKKQADREQLMHRYISQQREIARQEAYIEQQRRWNRERNIIAAESREKQLAKLKRIDAPEKDPRTIRIGFKSTVESANDVLTVSKLSKSYGKKLFSSISFEVKRGDRFMIVGANGTGKSTLIKILCGREHADSGVFEFGDRVDPGFYDQEQKTLSESNTVMSETVSTHERLTNTEIRTALASFLFFADDMEKPVSVLSGGERARLMLCKLILSRSNLLFLDEPTNHLDIPSREVLEDALMKYDGTVIAVSHDRYFLKKLATRILELPSGICYEGGYEDYAARKKESDAVTRTAKPVSEGKIEYLKNKQATANERKTAARIAKLERLIAEAEERRSALEAESCGEAATDYERLTEIAEEIGKIDDKLAEMYDEYGSLT